MSQSDKKLSYQIEAVQIGLYCDIIQSLLWYYPSLSIIKLLTFSFIIKKSHTLDFECYTANNKNDLVLKALSQISGRSSELYSQIPFIIKSLDILIASGLCETHVSEVIASSQIKSGETSISNFIKSAIDESISYTDRQFLKEVIAIV